MKRLILAGIIAFGAYTTYIHRAVEHGPGVIAPDAPRQTRISDEASFTFKGYKITPLARFELKARVLGTERYSMDRESDLSPIDFALGWGPMSDSAVLSKLDISQGNRFFRWYADKMPIPRQAITRNASNMHLVPADDEIAHRLKAIREGQVVSMKGYLIRADSPKGWRWVSSLTRDDSGKGACELFWVESVGTEGVGI